MTFTTIVPIAMELSCLWGPDTSRAWAQRPSSMTMHLTPGRLRLRPPERRGDERFARQIERAITPMPGVTGVRANPLTGSVLVHYDALRTDVRQILAELARIGLMGGWSAVAPPPTPPLAEVAVRVGAAIGKEVAIAMLAEAVGNAWFAPLLAVL